MTTLITTEEAALTLGVSPRTMERWRYVGEGPPYVKVCRQVKYRQTAIEKWIDSQEVEPANA